MILASGFVDPTQHDLLHVTIGGHVIERRYWHRVRPKSGQFVTVVPVPQGGQEILRTVLIIGIVAASLAAFTLLGPAAVPLLGVAGATVFASAASAAISVGGMLALNALIPPAEPELGSGQKGGTYPPTYSLEGGSNSARIWQPYRRVLGRHRIYPDLAAPWVTESVGDDVYLIGLLCWGYGPLQLNDLRIGDTLLSSYREVELESTQGEPGVVFQSTLYPSTIIPLGVQAALTKAAGRVTRRTSLATDYAWADLVAQGAISYGKKTGDELGIQVDFKVEYKEASSNVWIFDRNWTFSGKTTGVCRRSVKINLPARGQYDIAITRLTNDHDGEDATYRDQIQWLQLKSCNRDPPFTKDGMCMTAIRIRATEQLSGTIDRLNGLAHSILPVWNFTNSTWETQATSNPASLFLAILMGNGAKKPLDYDKIHLQSIHSWSEWCENKGWKCNFVFERGMSTWEALRIVAATGRAHPTCATGKWGVVQDRPQPFPLGSFTPRNMRGFKGTRFFVKVPSAVRVSFVDETRGFKVRERIVHGDPPTARADAVFTGGTFAGDVFAAGVFVDAESTPAIVDDPGAWEEWEFPGITNPELIYRHARFRLAEGILRPERYTCEMDFEHLVHTRGDLVRVAHDVPLYGVGWGRIKSLTLDETAENVVQITLDERLLLDGSQSYQVRVRLSGGTLLMLNLAALGGELSTLDLADPLPIADAPEVGDMATVLLMGVEDAEMLIAAIEPGSDLSAKVSLIPYAPAIFTADTETIPQWDPGITDPVGSLVPWLVSVVSDELAAKREADGSITVQVIVSIFDDGSRPLTKISGVELRWRLADTDAAWRYVVGAADSRELVITGATRNQEIELAVRFTFYGNVPGTWTALLRHLVIGPNLPPTDVSIIYLDGERVAWRVDVPDPDFAGYRLRYALIAGGHWEDAVPITDGIQTDTWFPVIELPLDCRRVLVKQVTRSGLESVGAIGVDVDPNTISSRVRYSVTDYAALRFPGVLATYTHTQIYQTGVYDPGVYDATSTSGGTTSGGEVVLDPDTGTYVLRAVDTSDWLTPPAGTWLEPPTADWLASTWDVIDYIFQFTCPAISTRQDRLFVEREGVGPVAMFYRTATGQQLEYIEDTDPPPPSIDPVPSPELPFLAFLVAGAQANQWFPLRSGVRPIPGTVVEFRLLSQGGTGQRTTITALRVVVDAQEIAESQTLTIPSAGITFVPTKTFRGVIFAHGIFTTPATGTIAAATLYSDTVFPSVVPPTVHAVDRDGQPVQADARVTIGGY